MWYRPPSTVPASPPATVGGPTGHRRRYRPSHHQRYGRRWVVEIVQGCSFKGGSGPKLLEDRFSAMNWGPWPKHVPITWGWFWVYKPNDAHARPWSKKWAKKPKSKKLRYSLAFNGIRFVLWFWCGRTSKSVRKWPSYAHSKLGQKWRPGLSWAEN